MRNTPSSDNIYPVGMGITAKVNPDLPLTIARYYQRIYYCSVVGQPDHKHFAYFERELVAPPQK
ncbi:hypothetical protein [Chryseolinea lacunae]|uniref:Uncharacterized protein n=1 Tax=Chryseolinea lacunae TaxID=2801331 RepID=A0ABS1KYT8_9BACT|nr:hypothetical protein [Chryseolinea lacunae]MBL0744579.1 hypothetical protein [Chryseolinea lacunae]